MGEITRLLGDFSNGDRDAFARVVEILYSDLEKLTKAEVKRRFGGRLNIITWVPGEVLSEVVIRLAQQRKKAKNRQEFFAATATLIGRVIADYKRRRRAIKRGGSGGRGAPLAEREAPARAEPIDQYVEQQELLKRFEAALEKLRAAEPRAAEILAMRVFAGLTRPQVIALTGLSSSVVDREWALARKWMERRLPDGKIDGPDGKDD